MRTSILLYYVALAASSPIDTSSAAPAATAPTINLNGAASSIASYLASPSFAPYSRPIEDVVEWIALGDSFTAGTGSNGNSEVFAGDAIRGQRSAPMQMKTDTDSWDFINTNGGGVPARFSFSAYTGDTTVELVTQQLVGGAYTSTNYQLPRHPFGAPQLAVMTIGGNDAYLSEIINNCLYRAWLPGNCDDSLNKLQDDITTGLFKDKISLALFHAIEFGRQQGGANPRDSFQVYISEYIPYFDETTIPCNSHSWNWWGSSTYLTQSLRQRLNSLTNQVNVVIKDAATELENMGVVFVGGIADQYISGEHQFCAPGHDSQYEMTDVETWFWSAWFPTGSDQEGLDATTLSASESFNATVLQPVLDFAYGKGKFTPETYEQSTEFTQNTTPYETFDDLLNAMSDSPVQEYSLASLQTKRSMHPKGTAFGIHKTAFMAAMADNRGSIGATHNGSTPTTTTSPPETSTTSKPTMSASPPPAQDTCGDWYKVFFDSFVIYGKNFDPSKFGVDGAGLENQLKGCGDLTSYHFTELTNDPNGYQWHASGNLPIGTKACVGRAVVSAGGNSPDGCHGAG